MDKIEIDVKEIDEKKIYIKTNIYFNIDFFNDCIEFSDGLATSKIVYQSFIPNSNFWILITKTSSVYIVSKSKLMFGNKNNISIDNVPVINFNKLNNINTLKTWIEIL